MLKKFLPGIIAILVLIAVIYVGLYWYVNNQANKMVNQALNAIRLGNQSAIQSIQYNNVEASPLSYFTHSYVINGITLTLKKHPKRHISIGQAAVSNVDINKAGFINTATFTLTDIQFSHWKAALLNSLGPNLKLALNNSVESLKISLNISASYIASAHALTLKVNVANNNQSFAWAQVNFSDFFINAPITDLSAWQPAAGNALNNAVVESSDFKLNTIFNQSAEQIIKQAPYFATTLGQLGYHKLAIKLDSDGQYDGKTRVSQQALRLSMKAGGDVTFAIHSKRKQPMHFVDLIAELEGLNWQQQNSSIQSMIFTISDRGWLTHANQLFQYEFGQSAYGYFKDKIRALPKDENWAIETKAAALAFLEQPGSTLNISAKPTQPFYPDQLSAYARAINKIVIADSKNSSIIGRSINNNEKTNNQQLLDLIEQLMKKINYHATQY